MDISVNIATNIKTPEVKRKVNDAAAKALKDTILDIENTAKKLAPPLDHPHPTGNNRRSITSEAKELSASCYSTSGYGGWLEVGHKKPNPRPYLFPALTMHFTQAKFAEKIKDNLK